MREAERKLHSIKRIDLTGNVVPNSWFKMIISDKGKPNMTVIVILADIVERYRSFDQLEDGMVRRSYDQIADQFCISKQSATRAVVFLESIGAVKRVFRTVATNDTVLSNVLFVRPNMERIFELSSIAEES